MHPASGCCFGSWFIAGGAQWFCSTTCSNRALVSSWLRAWASMCRVMISLCLRPSPLVDDAQFAIDRADFEAFFVHALGVVINHGDVDVGREVHDFMDEAALQEDEDLLGGELDDFLDQLLFDLQHGPGQFSKRGKPQMPGFGPFVQVTDGLVVIENGNVCGVLVTGIGHPAEVEVCD